MNIDYRYLTGLGLACLLNVFLGGYSANALFWIAILLFGVALVQYLLFSLSLKVRLEAPHGRVEVGEQAPVTLILKNRGIVAMPYLSAALEALKDRRVMALGAREERSLTFDFSPRVRGVMEVGSLCLEFSDVLNILTGRRLFQPAPIKVYPRVTEDAAADMVWNTLAEGHYFRNYARENPYTLREMRPYRPGDSIRKINWKVSAKYNELYVKGGEATAENKILIVLDMNREILAMDLDGVYENSLVSAALALSKGLLRQGIPHGFILSNDGGLFHIASAQGYQGLEEYLVLNKANSASTLAQFIQENHALLRERRTLIFFSRPLEGEVNACEALKRPGNEVIFCAPHLGHSGIAREGRGLMFRDLGGAGDDLG